ncbi:MAG: 50S ribosomal protein L25 [Candidatus Kapabacteria bacterium]|jgi:large subunit ribosomal protein L25|nr:50S ribosomal protein L25 [Candidatus Kapabacteria bacterium]
MSEATLTVKTRETGKKASKAVRKSGLIPGVFYKKNTEPVAIYSDSLTLRPFVYTNQARTIQLSIEGTEKSYKTFLKEVTFHPVTDKILHFDLMGLESDQKITVVVPIKLIGTSIGVRNGGVMQHTLRKVKITCTANDLPEFISVNVTALEIAGTINLDAIKNEKYEFALKDNAVICSIARPRVKVAEAPQGKK